MVRNLKKSFDKKQAVNNISFGILKGEVILLKT